MPGSGETGPEVIPIVSDEELLQRRHELHGEVGILAGKLSEITGSYHDCIQEIILTTDEIRRRGLDTAGLERQTTYSSLPNEEAGQRLPLPIAVNL